VVVISRHRRIEMPQISGEQRLPSRNMPQIDTNSRRKFPAREPPLRGLKAQAISYVYCENGRCGLEFVLTAGCHWDTYNGAWQEDGYYRWRCWECE